MTFHHDTGKGSRPREYSVTQDEFGKKFDAIDWGKKAEAPRTCMKCPRDVDMRCGYCGLLQADGSVRAFAYIIGEDVPPMTQEKIDELNAVLDEYEE